MPTAPTPTLPHSFPPPLTLPRLARLGYGLDAAMLFTFAALAGIGLAVTVGWPELLLPTYAQHGPRHWLVCIAVGVILAASLEVLGNRTEAELATTRAERQTLLRGHGWRLSLAVAALSVFTTQPVWGQLAHMWASNDPHAFSAAIGALGARILPGLGLLLLALFVPAAIGAYRNRLQRQQASADDLATEPDEFEDEANGTSTPGGSAPVTPITTEPAGPRWTEQERGLLDRLRDTITDGFGLLEPVSPAAVLHEAIAAIRSGDQARTERDHLRTELHADLDAHHGRDTEQGEDDTEGGDR